MIPRRVKRLFDQRGEPRAVGAVTALLDWRGARLTVRLANLSPSGAMLSSDDIPDVGEAVALYLPDRAPIPAVVRWVRDGAIGIHFDASVG